MTNRFKDAHTDWERTFKGQVYVKHPEQKKSREVMGEALLIAEFFEDNLPELKALVAEEYEMHAVKDYHRTDEQVDRHNEEGIVSLATKAANARPILKELIERMNDGT